MSSIASTEKLIGDSEMCEHTLVEELEETRDKLTPENFYANTAIFFHRQRFMRDLAFGWMLHVCYSFDIPENELYRDIVGLHKLSFGQSRDCLNLAIKKAKELERQ